MEDTDMPGTSYDGSIELIYVATDQPSDPKDPNEYTLVGLQRSHSVNATANEIDASNKEEGTATLPGEIGYTIPIEAIAPKEGDEGQDLLEEAFLNKATIYWLGVIVPDESSPEAGTVGRHGRGKILQFTHTANRGEAATHSFQINGIGTYTRFMVST